MRVLVTGAAGYIGSFVSRELVSAGHEVVAVDNLSEGHREALPEGVPLAEVDVGDGPAIRSTVADWKPDAAVHLAAFTLIPPSMREPTNCFEVNVNGGINLLRALIENDVNRVVFSSTAAVYGQPKTVPVPESHPCSPMNPYGESKLMFERILRWSHVGQGVRSISFRFFNVAGALPGLGEKRSVETHLLPLLFRVAQGETPIVQVFGGDYPTKDGSAVRDYVHVRDVARAHVFALEWLGEHDMCESVNLGSGAAHSVLDMVDTVARVTGRELPHEIAPRRPGDPATLTADITKARELLGWTPDHSDLDEIVASSWEWQLRNSPTS